MSFNTSLSRLSSATNRFSFAFSCSNSFRRFAWSTCNPPYSLRQRKYVCSTISASLHACAVVLPFAHGYFDLSQQVHYLLRLIPLASCHSRLLSCQFPMFSTGTKFAGHSI